MRIMAGISLAALIALPLSSAAQDEPAPHPEQYAAPHAAQGEPAPHPEQQQAAQTAAQGDIAPMSGQDARFNPPPASQQGGLEAIVHRDTAFNGPFLSVRNAQPNLNPGWEVRSIRVRSGEWQVCTGRNYTGRCTTIDRDQAVLSPQFRAVASMRPTGGWGTGVGESLRGSASEFFPAPLRNGQRIECTGSNCARSAANEFCRRVGWLLSRSQATETVNGRNVIADVLCARNIL